MAYIKGNRNQLTMLPASIEDYIAADDPVRAYDAFVEALDLDQLGFVSDENQAGASPYWPQALLKLLLYGYAYGLRSSRRLERLPSQPGVYLADRGAETRLPHHC